MIMDRFLSMFGGLPTARDRAGSQRTCRGRARATYPHCRASSNWNRWKTERAKRRYAHRSQRPPPAIVPPSVLAPSPTRPVLPVPTPVISVPPASVTYTATPADSGAAGINPLTVTSQLSPSQVLKAYGLSPRPVVGSFTGDGAGQTIAIIDAYQDPNITGDLATFDSHFGLPAPPNFLVLNQSGTSDLSGVPLDIPTPPNSPWSTEIALDVEWAHAMAPNANIILFEANSNGSDLYTAVSTASGYVNGSIAPSVVSMSWGSSEFFGETALDSTFTTPSGHTGVTFVASTGDNGAPGEYPAFSPNVLAIGGTTLDIADSSGTYSIESGWSGSGGGSSSYPFGHESKPSYQNALNSSSRRETPDVSFDADPSSGVLVYDSWNGGAGGVVERRRHQCRGPLLGRPDRHRQRIPRESGEPGNAQPPRKSNPNPVSSLRVCRIDEQLQSITVL